MDTVWIKLSNPNVEYSDESEYFMFGPTGVVRFRRNNRTTLLFNSAKTLVGEVKESPEEIMITLAKIRGTTNKLNSKPKRRK